MLVHLQGYEFQSNVSEWVSVYVWTAWQSKDPKGCPQSKRLKRGLSHWLVWVRVCARARVCVSSLSVLCPLRLSGSLALSFKMSSEGSAEWRILRWVLCSILCVRLPGSQVSHLHINGLRKRDWFVFKCECLNVYGVLFRDRTTTIITRSIHRQKHWCLTWVLR